MKIDIEDLKKIKIDKDDVLIIKTRQTLLPNQRKAIESNLKHIFTDNKILCYPEKDIELILCNYRRDFDEVKTL